jgi:aspartate aminotransferase
LVDTSITDNWRVTPDQLARICEEDPARPRLLVLNYPGNPDGGSYTAEQLEGIATVARRFGVILLSDEIYGQLHHKGKHVSVARFYPEGTIISSGISKWCGAGGWRLGTFAFPSDLAWLMDAMAVVASETYTSVSAPIQFASVRAFKADLELERYLWHTRRILEGLGQRCAQMLSQAGVRVHAPVGAFYLFPDFTPFQESLRQDGITNSTIFCERLLQETGVAILPGAAFQRPAEELTARFAYVGFDGAKALAASETLALDQALPDDFLEYWCGEVIEATERIVEWVTAPRGSVVTIL